MRKIIVILLLMPLFSCNDWLTVEPEKAVTFVNYFKSEQDLQDVVISMHLEAKRVFAPSIMSRAFEVCGLQCTSLGNQEGYRNLDPEVFLERGSTSGNNVYGREGWTLQYNIMYLADFLIENRFRFEGISEERADYWIAQANFQKALIYFDLARNWGDAPLAPGSENIEVRAKSPADTILLEAIRCAEKALVLPTYDKLTDAVGGTIASKQYASLGTVHTLLANIYAWLGGLYPDKKEYWEKAVEHASLVIDKKAGDYELEPDIAALLKNTLGRVRVSKETIFAMEMNSTDDQWMTMASRTYCYPGWSLVNFPFTTNDPQEIARKNNIPRIRCTDVEKLFNERDVRRDSFFVKLDSVYMVTNSYTGEEEEYISLWAFLKKWREPVRPSDPKLLEYLKDGFVAMDGNRVVWRLADLILLRGECRARLGLPEAKDDLNRVRERAGLGKYAGSTAAESLREEIFHERERELFGEGQRYYDFVRNGYFRDISIKYRTLTDDELTQGALYLPVAKRSFTKNTLMKQNAYWLWQ